MIAAITTLGDLAQTAGVVVAALLAAVVLLAGSPRARAAAMLAALVLTPVLLVANIWSTPQFEPLRERPGAAARGRRGRVSWSSRSARWRSTAGPSCSRSPPPPRCRSACRSSPAATRRTCSCRCTSSSPRACSPTRCRACARRAAWRRPRREDAAEGPYRRGALQWLLAGAVVLYAVQATYSSDFDGALAQTIFFYVPFALLYALLVRIAWTPQLAGRCLIVLVVLATAFVGIGFVEYAKRELLLNPKVISSNQFESYFRVNSLFFDPNIYGRFLATVMLALAALLLWTRRTVAGDRLRGRARACCGRGSC